MFLRVLAAADSERIADVIREFKRLEGSGAFEVSQPEQMAKMIAVAEGSLQRPQKSQSHIEYKTSKRQSHRKPS